MYCMNCDEDLTDATYREHAVQGHLLRGSRPENAEQAQEQAEAARGLTTLIADVMAGKLAVEPVEPDPTFKLTVTYAAGHDQEHPGLSVEQIDSGTYAFLSDLVNLRGKGITKFMVEIEGVEAADAG